MKAPVLLSGMTLLEMLVSIALFSVIMLSLCGIVVSYYGLYGIQEKSINVGTTAHATIDAFERAGRSADAVVAWHRFSGVTYATGQNVVIFELPSVDVNEQLIPGIYDYIALVASGTDVYQLSDAWTRSIRPSGRWHLSDVLSSLVFTYDTPNPVSASVVSADVSTDDIVGARTLSARLTEQVYLRNR